jgi:hypothetical protein
MLPRMRRFEKKIAIILSQVLVDNMGIDLDTLRDE